MGYLINIRSYVVILIIYYVCTVIKRSRIAEGIHVSQILTKAAFSSSIIGICTRYSVEVI